MMAMKNLHQRIAEVMKVVTYLQREAKQGMNYKIISHDAVTAKVRGPLLEQGVVYYPIRCEHTHNGNRAECSITMRFVNIDEPTDFFDVQSFGYGVDPQDKGPGKAMSYAVKYALLKTLGLETGDDADHDSINHSAVDPDVPKFDPRAAADVILKRLNTAQDMPALAGAWGANAEIIGEIKSHSAPIFAELNAAKEARKTELTKQDAA